MLLLSHRGRTDEVSETLGLPEGVGGAVEIEWEVVRMGQVRMRPQSQSGLLDVAQRRPCSAWRVWSRCRAREGCVCM